jgi:hypothetical protein
MENAARFGSAMCGPVRHRNCPWLLAQSGFAALTRRITAVFRTREKRLVDGLTQDLIYELRPGNLVVALANFLLQFEKALSRRSHELPESDGLNLRHDRRFAELARPHTLVYFMYVMEAARSRQALSIAAPSPGR